MSSFNFQIQNIFNSDLFQSWRFAENVKEIEYIEIPDRFNPLDIDVNGNSCNTYEKVIYDSDDVDTIESVIHYIY
jgi:hypothetical protein